METTNLRNFIISHENWEEILIDSPYSLQVTRDDGLIMFKYNQINSDFSLPEVKEARGIIFDESDWTCVCRAFDKFGNYGESYVKDLDWENGVSVQEKVDGSLMKTFYYKGKWRLATNGSIDAFKTLTGDARYKTFGDLFEKALLDIGYQSYEQFAVDNLNPNCTTMFELVSPVNRVVIPYSDYKIYYLGQRQMKDMKEINLASFWKGTGVEVPKRYELKTVLDVIKSAESLPWDQEGYVCVDKNYDRCKIKSPQYVLAHYTRNNNVISNRRLLEVILNNEVEEFLIYADDFKNQIDEIKQKIEDYKQANLEAFREVTNRIPQKEFAKLVMSNPKYKKYSVFMFDAYNEEKAWENIVKNWTINRWMRVLNLEGEE